MANESYIGRYGQALRRMTALEAGAGTGAFAPQVVGGADAGGFGPSLQVSPMQNAPGVSAPSAQPAPEAAAKPAGGGMGGIAKELGGMFGGGNSGMMSGGGGFTDGSGSGSGVMNALNGGGGPMFAARGGALSDGDTIVGEEGPELISKQGNNAVVTPNDQLQQGFGPPPQQGPIAMGGDKPTSFRDITSGADDDQKEELANHIEKQAGPGGLKAMWKRVGDVLGGRTPEGVKTRHDIALSVSEIALRAMSKRSDPRYAQNPDGVFADAVLEYEADRKAADETKRLEDRKDTETKRVEARTDAETVRKEGRTDAETARKEGREDTQHTRDRSEKEADDKREFEQAKELARLQAKLLKEKGQKTVIIYGEDGIPRLVDAVTGDAAQVTEEVETTTTQGSRGKGTTSKTTKTRRPVKVAPKANASDLDADAVNRAISKFIEDRSKTDRNFRKLSAQEQNSIAREEVMKNAAAAAGVAGGGSNPASGKVINFTDLP